MNRCRKLLRNAIIIFSCILFSADLFAQLTIGTVDPGPYTPGSTIAATLTIGSACIQQGNTFNLRLSDASGNFSPGIIIGTYDGFYTTYVNGEIPIGTPAGSLYKVRIESTTPVLVSSVSAPFEVRAGLTVDAKLTSTYLKSGNTETFGSCASGPNKIFKLKNESTTGSTVKAAVVDGIDGALTNINFTTPIQDFTAQYSHYTIFTRAELPDGSVGTKAYLIINNKTVTAFSTDGNNIVCLPSGELEFTVITSGVGGIQNNFPGDTYEIKWGDGFSDVYTICDIKQKGGIVSHKYSRSSCGNAPTAGGIYNAFDVTISVKNDFCGNMGAPLSSYAKVVVRPVNSFTGPLTACANTPVTFLNTSVRGDDPNTSSPNCIPNDVTYSWVVDGVTIETGMPLSYNFVHTFTTNGPHVVRLESSNSGACSAEDYEQVICIQNAPKPNFSLATTTICAGTTLLATDLSVVDNTCNIPIYSWIVTPAVGYANGTNSSSPNPEFTFTNPGSYSIVLNISSASCGLISSTPQTVIVNQAPTVTLSPSLDLCNLSTYEFSDVTIGPTKTTFNGTYLEQPNTYTWTVIGGLHSFENSTNPNTKYPSIKFNEYKTYTISVTHTNNCGSETKTQVISFLPSPTVTAGNDLSICYNDSAFLLRGTVSGSPLSVEWVGGSGTFSPNRNDLNASYTPTTAERNAGIVSLILRATTLLASPCNQIDDIIKLTIKPDISITSATTKTICTGTSVAYDPTNNVVGTTFNWTATGSSSAGGYAPFGTGQINDLLSNSDPLLDATVTYIITPNRDGCAGTPFQFIASISPRPIITHTSPTSPICNNTSSSITLFSNLTGTKYSYSSVVSAGHAVGNTQKPVATTTSVINDIITNTGLIEATITYSITSTSVNGCDAVPFNIDVKIAPHASLAFAGADDQVCNTSTYTLNGNNPDVGTGKWTAVTAPNAVNFTDETKYNTSVTGLLAGNTYEFMWTITDLNGCASTSDNVEIIINEASVGGTTSGSTAVCAGNSNGTITLTGQVGTILYWQSSSDGIIWNSLGNAGQASISYSNLMSTTYYRAVIQSGICPEAYSTETLIKVNQGAVVALVGPDQTICGGNSATLTGTNPETNSGLWALIPAQPGITITDPNLYNTTVTGLVPGQTYIFRWTISGLAPCPSTSADLKITIDLPTVGGTTAGDATFCSPTNAGSISLSGQTGQILRWQSSTDGAVWADINSTANPFNYLNLTTTTQFRAVVASGICAEEFSSVSTITVNSLTVEATAGPDQEICSGNSIILTANNPLPNTGLWTLVSGQLGVNIASPSSHIVTVTGLSPGQTYTFRWTITGFASCPPSYAETQIKYYPTVTNIISASATPVCTGENITITGSVATGGTGVYSYQWQNSIDGLTFKDILSETNKDLSLTISTSEYYRRIVNSGMCLSTSNAVQIIALPAIGNNIISADQAVCVGNIPLPITGTLPTGGAGAYDYQWQSSLDGTVWVNIAGEANINLILPAPTITILYRRIAKSAACTGTFENTSNAVTVTLNPHAKAEFTYANDKGCAPFALMATNIIAVTHPDRNATYTWFADNVAIGTGTPFPGYTIANGNETVIIKLVTTSSLNCNSDEMSQSFSTPQKIVASFTQSSTGSCSPLPVTFTNTSNSLSAGTFLWDFGNGTTSNLASPPPINFLSTTNGRDTTYIVKLTSISNCETTTATSTVFVSGKATSVFSPDKTLACTGSTITFTNFSPGNTNTYKYDFDDGTTVGPTTDKNPVSHQFNTPVVRDYNVKLTVENSCGTSTSSHVIRIFPNNIIPSFFVNGNNTEGCAPLSVRFTNNTQGASSFVYDFGDGGSYSSNGGGVETVTHNFTTPGDYEVKLYASNSCFTAPVQIIPIKVYAQPSVSFSADKTIGCDGATIKFKNTSIGGISFIWDFGDGTTSDQFEPTHTYSGSGSSYTVSLTARNTMGCSNTATLNNYISIAMPPLPNFTVSPSNEITIPNYTFKFNDTSIGTAGGWEWNFGDGSTSTLQNPTHTYNEVGKFNVTLKVNNVNGCSAITNQEVRITGIPGYLNLPNSFMPGSASNELRTFKAKGMGILEWKMTVFNKWGQILWETVKLDQNEPSEGWDGTFNGKEQPQGVYYWKIDVKFRNGGDWKGMTYDSSAPKKTGMIYLIR